MKNNKTASTIILASEVKYLKKGDAMKFPTRPPRPLSFHNKKVEDTPGVEWSNYWRAEEGNVLLTPGTVPALIMQSKY